MLNYSNICSDGILPVNEYSSQTQEPNDTEQRIESEGLGLSDSEDDTILPTSPEGSETPGTTS